MTPKFKGSPEPPVWSKLRTRHAQLAQSYTCARIQSCTKEWDVWSKGSEWPSSLDLSLVDHSVQDEVVGTVRPTNNFTIWTCAVERPAEDKSCWCRFEVCPTVRLLSLNSLFYYVAQLWQVLAIRHFMALKVLLPLDGATPKCTFHHLFHWNFLGVLTLTL